MCQAWETTSLSVFHWNPLRRKARRGQSQLWVVCVVNCTHSKVRVQCIQSTAQNQQWPKKSLWWKIMELPSGLFPLYPRSRPHCFERSPAWPQITSLVTNYDLKHQTSNLKSFVLQVVIVPALCFRKTTRTLMPRPEACTAPRDLLLLMFQLHPTSQRNACWFNSESTSIPSWPCCWNGSCGGALNAYDGSSAHSEPENHIEFLRSDKV